ncbi:MAG: Obg family GTPase CgtA, partial [Actinobacteria bacterium]|nr:Obg family GTPase CgtA [Actinomycetota bacterium]
AVGYLADRMQKLGIDDALVKAGATAGATVVIGPGSGVVFDWEPTMTSAAEVQMGARGSDLRVDQSNRRTNKERRDEYHDLMDAKAEARAELERERKAGMWREDS